MKFSDPGGGRNDLTLSTGSWPSSTVLGGTATCHGYVSFIPPTLDSVTSAATGPSRSTLDTPSRSTPVTTTRTAIPTAFSSHTPGDQRCASHSLAAAPSQRGNAHIPRRRNDGSAGRSGSGEGGIRTRDGGCPPILA